MYVSLGNMTNHAVFLVTLLSDASNIAEERHSVFEAANAGWYPPYEVTLMVAERQGTGILYSYLPRMRYHGNNFSGTLVY